MRQTVTRGNAKTSLLLTVLAEDRQSEMQHYNGHSGWCKAALSAAQASQNNVFAALEAFPLGRKCQSNVPVAGPTLG